jgi:hypothetical protein
LKPHILDNLKTKILNIIETRARRFPIPLDSICAHVRNKIIPYTTYSTSTFHTELLILKDDETKHFFVTFQNCKGEFINIAKGSKVCEKEFSDYVECIWEVYNLQGWTKNYLKMKLLLNMPYQKYLCHVFKHCSWSGKGLCHAVDAFSETEIFQYIQQNVFNSDNFCAQIFIILFLMPFSVIFVGVYYTILCIGYYASMLPFFILAFPFKYFNFVLNWYVFSVISQGLASLYVCCFPHLKYSAPFKIGEIEIIKPKHIMSVVPLLVQRRKNCYFEYVDTFRFCYLIWIFGIPFTLIFALADIYL